MKKKIVIFGLAGVLVFSSVSFAAESMDNTLKKGDALKTEIGLEDNVIIESETISVDLKGAGIEVKIPVIKGLSNIKYQEELNKLIRLSVEKEIEEFKVNAKKGMETSKTLEPKLSIDYEVKSNGDILSFVINSYAYLGGANGISRKDYYNIDIKENKDLELKDLFKGNEDYKSLINTEVNRQIKEQVLDETKTYFEGDEGFKSIGDNQDFYIDKDGNLVITFDKYEIAPGSMGHPEFKIPRRVLMDILKDGEAIVRDGNYCNLDYNYSFGIPPIWENKVKIVEKYDTEKDIFSTSFVYMPENKGIEGKEFMTITVINKKDYKENKKDTVLGKTLEYIYLAKFPESNPYTSNKLEAKEFERLSEITNGVDDLFQIPEAERILNFNKVKINGKELELKNQMFKSEKGNIMIPIAEIAKILGFEVKWDGDNKVVNINKGAVSAGAHIDKNVYYFSKALVYLDEGGQLIKGTTYVPMSFMDEVLKGIRFVDGDGILNIEYQD
jgi:hypothetical protein